MFPSELEMDVVEIDRIYNKWRNISPVPRFDKLPYMLRYIVILGKENKIFRIAEKATNVQL